MEQKDLSEIPVGSKRWMGWLIEIEGYLEAGYMFRVGNVGLR